MDETERYQQRLQAIAEKRRLQEEQDRAKRQLEDEKLRLQQLKRKSLRDQWLMEGPPLSPDSAGPRSPLWGTQTQQIDKLQTEIVEKTHKHKEDSSTSAQSHTDHHGNGERVSALTPPPSGSSASGEEKHTDPSHNTSLTNGNAQDKKSHNALSQHVNDISKGVETLLFLGYTEAEPGQGLCDDDDDVSAVIRAERVIIVEEGEEAKGEYQDMLTEEEEEQEEEREVTGREKGREEEAQEEREEEQERENGEEQKEGQEKEQEEERVKEGEEEQVKEKEEEQKERLEEEGEEEGEEVNAANVKNHLEMSTEAGEVTELEDGLGHNDRELNADEDTTGKIPKQADEETSANTCTDENTKPVNDSKPALNTDLTPAADPAAATVEESAEAETQSLSETPGGAPQAPSVSSTVPASALNPNSAHKSQGLAASSTNAAVQFQEIPLDGDMVEEEPLLATKVEPLTDTLNPNQAEGTKTKTCQCCSVM